MADKVYATVKVEGQIEVLVRGDENTRYGEVLRGLGLFVTAASDLDCDVEILQDAVRVASFDITDAE